MKDAQALIIMQNEERIAASRAELETTHATAWENFQTALNAKYLALNTAIDQQNADWAAMSDARDSTIADAATAAREAIADAKATMVAALDASEKEIRWSITSIYNYDYQHALNEGLNAARAEMDATCDSRVEALEA